MNTENQKTLKPTTLPTIKVEQVEQVEQDNDIGLMKVKQDVFSKIP